MDSSDLFNRAVRVKEEPIDESLIQYNGKMMDEKPDLKNLQLLTFPSENSTRTIRKCNIKLENELDDEVEIVVECENVKPYIHLLAVNKVEEDSQNFLQDMKDTDGCKTRKIIKVEPVGEIMQQKFVGFAAEESNLNLNCELKERSKKRRIEKSEHNLKMHIGTTQNDK
ncbi:uncharacterized protein LOC106653651 [Trichogramma pretiosum]|uniref:uncharacterized protein LOC106653651 n=1 Tax=Trichogramma pretiosum TaxID=7493 RepID=UPI0006C994FB|nr:uncharacterized protein LOC106653651 [Trichogramma pretiosum]